MVHQSENGATQLSGGDEELDQSLQGQGDGLPGRVPGGALFRLLEALQMQCSESDYGLLLHAFMCPVCDSQSHTGATTTVDQIRAVYDAFRLIDADCDGQITLTGLCVCVCAGVSQV